MVSVTLQTGLALFSLMRECSVGPSPSYLFFKYLYAAATSPSLGITDQDDRERYVGDAPRPQRQGEEDRP